MKFIKPFVIFTIILLSLIGAFVIYFDPFYHFHAPSPGTKAVLNQPEYQVIGTIRSFDYDSVIVGTSMAENYNNGWFDDSFDCQTIKLIKTGGVTTEHAYYLSEAFDTKDLKNVFYSLDVAALCSIPEYSFPDDSMPLYLYDKNPFNDISYILNKDVVFKHIPYMLAQSKSADYIEGDSYNFAKDKNFSYDGAIANYIRSDIKDIKEHGEYESAISSNIELIRQFVTDHPVTNFYIFIPTYSCLWWDGISRSGELEETYYAIEKAAKELSAYDNVFFYCFIDNKDISDNLDNYMDAMHFSPSINEWIVSQLSSTDCEYMITPDNLNMRIKDIRSFGKHEVEYSSFILDN